MLSILRHIVYLNVVVSLSTALLSAGFAHMIGLREDASFYGVFAFFSTLAVYNGQRLFKIVDAQTNWMVWVKSNKKMIQSMTAISALISILVVLPLISLYRDFTIFYLFSLVAFVAVFYVIKIRSINLREIPWIKIHLIALTWVIVLIVFPALRFEIVFPKTFILLCAAHYSYVLAVTIPFDIRDLKYDKPTQRTIPQVFGILGSKIISISLLLIFSAIMIFLVEPLSMSPVFYLAVVVQMVFVAFMNPDRSDLYCAGGIDGAIALLGLAYFLV